MSLLEQQINRYEEAVENTGAAIEMLTTFVDENQTTLILAELLKYGFQDQFVTNLLTLWKAWSLKLIKEKARVHVEKSAFVTGVVDETGLLRGHSNVTEGDKNKNTSKLPQIFLQLSSTKHRKAQIVQGVCIIGRNPSLHAGDIRVVQAVNQPKLRHSKDVVVFPSTGDKPLPSMLSGGDLDGDDFFVIWEPSLIPKRWNTPPMPIEAVSPALLDRDVNIDDLRNFVVQYMKNDSLPLIATAHLAFADSAGVNSAICLQLAKLHSKAVDYPKTGIPAEWSHVQFSPKRWPHFMEKRNSYRSRKALGQLYDRVAQEDTRFQPRCGDRFDQRVIEKFEFTPKVLNQVKEIKGQYDFAVRRILRHHLVATEFELYSGWAMSRPAVGSDYKRQEVLGQEFSALKERFRDICYEAAGGRETDLLDPFVAAMYKVTEDEVRRWQRGDETGNEDVENDEVGFLRKPLISFPWIFHWILIRIAIGEDYKPAESVLAAARRFVPLKLAKENIPPESEAKYEEAKNMVEEAVCDVDGDGGTSGPPDGSTAATKEDPEIREERNGNTSEEEPPREHMPDGSTADAYSGEIEAQDTAMDRLLKLMGSDSEDEE